VSSGVKSGPTSPSVVKRIVLLLILIFFVIFPTLVVSLFLNLFLPRTSRTLSSILNRLSKRILEREKVRLSKPSNAFSTETPTTSQSNPVPLGSSNPDLAPPCSHCGQPMQKNTAVSTPYVTQFICACMGTVHFVNIHKGDKTREGKT